VAGRHGVPSRAASAQSSAPHAERGRVHVGRAAVVDGEVGRAVNRPGGRAVPGAGLAAGVGFPGRRESREVWIAVQRVGWWHAAFLLVSGQGRRRRCVSNLLTELQK